MKTPFIVGTRCYLRPVLDSDVNANYLSWLNDPDVSRYLGLGRFPISEAELRASLERFRNSTTDVILAIADKESDEHVGNVTLNRIHWIHRTADTGLIIGNKDFWGRGIATEAWTLLLEHAFKKLNLNKVIATVVEGHGGSQTALERVGFQVEGRQPQEYFLDGEYHDYIRLGLFARDFLSNRKEPLDQKGVEPVTS